MENSAHYSSIVSTQSSFRSQCISDERQLDIFLLTSDLFVLSGEECALDEDLPYPRADVPHASRDLHSRLPPPQPYFHRAIVKSPRRRHLHRPCPQLCISRDVVADVSPVRDAATRLITFVFEQHRCCCEPVERCAGIGEKSTAFAAGAVPE
jgi:hypothetical protein